MNDKERGAEYERGDRMEKKDPIKIDPTAIPLYAYYQACAVLASSIRAALADPEIRREHGDWKAIRTADSSAE